MNEKKKKIFIAKKNKEEYYLREVKEYFEDKNKYLQLNNNITLGNFYIKEKNNYKSDKNVHSIISKYPYGEDSYIDQKPYNTIESKISRNKNKSISRPKTASEATIPIKARNNNKFLISKTNKNLKKYYEIKTPKEILNLFNQYKRNINNNKHKNNFISENLKDDFRKKYEIQEKTLINREKNLRNNKMIAKFLSHKCNKNKNNLLLNSNNKYLHKKQLINYFNNNNNISQKMGDYYWLINLKRSNDTKKEYKTNYINIGNDKHEMWERYFDPGNDDLELVINPNYETFEKDNIGKNEQYAIINSFKDLKVDGKNLLKKEFNCFMNEIKYENEKNNVRIKLYKDPNEQKMKNIRNLLFKENNFKYQRFKRNEKPLKKSFSISHKYYSNKNKTQNPSNFIYL